MCVSTRLKKLASDLMEKHQRHSTKVRNDARMLTIIYQCCVLEKTLANVIR